MTPAGPGIGDTSMVGKVGRVTGKIAQGEIGEVMLPVGGGTSAFHAYAMDGRTTFPVGARVLVVDYRPPQAVYVEELPGFLQMP